MALIQKKFIGDDQVGAAKIRLENDSFLRARNAADNADIDVLKVNASNIPDLNANTTIGGATIATTADIPATFRIQGNWNASTNTPTLTSGVNPIDPLEFPLYIVSVAGTTTLDGETDWEVGDKAYFANGVWYKADNNDAVASVNSQTGVVVLDTDDVGEGVTNLYFTDARARTAAVDDTAYDATSWNGVTDIAPSKNAVRDEIEVLRDEISSAVGSTNAREIFTLSAGNISDGYVDLTQEAIPESVMVTPVGGLLQELTVDFTLTVPVAVTRVTFAGTLAATLVAGDKLIIHYEY